MQTPVDSATPATSGIAKAKLKASGIHFGLSACIYLVLLYFVIFRWYPGVLFETDGGWQGIRILGGVDLVLGPLLTLIVFNPRKGRREIAADLGIVALLQVAALAWGIHMVYGQRPVVLAYSKDSMYSVKPDRFDAQKVTHAQLATFGPEPALAYAEPPHDVAVASQSLLMSLNQQLNEWEQFMLYRSFAPNFPAIVKDQPDSAAQIKRYPEVANEMETKLKQLGGSRDKYVIVRFQGRYRDALLIFSHDGKLLDGVPLPARKD